MAGNGTNFKCIRRGYPPHNEPNTSYCGRIVDSEWHFPNADWTALFLAGQHVPAYIIHGVDGFPSRPTAPRVCKRCGDIIAKLFLADLMKED